MLILKKWLHLSYMVEWRYMVEGKYGGVVYSKFVLINQHIPTVYHSTRLYWSIYKTFIPDATPDKTTLIRNILEVLGFSFR